MWLWFYPVWKLNESKIKWNEVMYKLGNGFILIFTSLFIIKTDREFS
jgi:hypothetical protein